VQLAVHPVKNAKGGFVEGECNFAITKSAVFGSKCTANRLAVWLCSDPAEGENEGKKGRGEPDFDSRFGVIEVAGHTVCW